MGRGSAESPAAHEGGTRLAPDTQQRAQTSLVIAQSFPLAARRRLAMVSRRRGRRQMDYLTNLYYNYSYSQTIYTQAQISQGGTIQSIQFEYDGYSSGGTRNWTVYMGHTTKSSFSSTSDWISTGSMTQVFSGNYTFNTSSGWYEIDLDTDFDYNN